ncbi:MAG: ASKHA domain-containing protein [Oscillospiraceae bacterium]|nr:ASKHA domain-containing protein [Oscillospiraceae bacterium]
MPEITFLPQNITVEINLQTKTNADAAPRSSLLEAARLAGVSVETPCGGAGICRKCLVKIISGEVEVKSGSYKNEKENHVLICQANILDSDVTVGILSGLYTEKGSFDDDINNIIDFEINPGVKQIDLQAAKSNYLDGLSDLDRLTNALKKTLPDNFADIKIPLPVLNILPVKLRQNNGKIKVIYYFDNNILNIISIENTEKSDINNMYGVAIDIGTTTVTLWLADIITGEIISKKTDYNDQIECGLDVISRINYAQKNSGELKRRVLKTVNNLISQTAGENNIDINRIYRASIAGNTVMTHLFLGIIPEYIRLDPYTPAVFKVPAFNSLETGVNINPYAPVSFAPSVGSYVGGDITAGILSTPLCKDEDNSGIILFLDIGTNGEILLGRDDFILGCACSAGPAFEGGGIEFGMRASSGAIDDFKIDENNNIIIKTVNNAEPMGICGSGIISVTAEMFRRGIIDAAGRFTDKMPEKINKNKKPYKFYITDNITLSEADIDNFIRAKGAVFSACRTLLNSAGITFGDIDKIYIAGGFGKYLNINDAKTMGLLPNIAEEKIIYLGNTSISGAYQMLISEEKRRKVSETSEKITYIDLSGETGYMDEYIAALFIPHTDIDLFV